MSKSFQKKHPLDPDYRAILPRNLTNISLSIADRSTRYSLSELLPYTSQIKSGNRLIAGLKEYDFLLTATEHTAQWLSKNQISAFDPLVGENACQIRALKNCLIFSQYPVCTHEFLAKTQLARRKIDEFFRDTSELIKSNFPLTQILENLNIDIKLTYNEIYLIQSYILTIVKTIKPSKPNMPFVKNEYTDRKKLNYIRPINRIFIESLVKKLRESLSAFSVSFMQELSSRLASGLLKNALSDRFYIRYNNLHCLPCYWVTKLLLIHSLENQIPLIFIFRQLAKDQNYNILREVPLFFKPTAFGYKHAPMRLFNLNSPSLVLLVNACRKTHEFPDLMRWKEELLKYNPLDLILASTASHRQYPDVTKGDLINQIQDEEYDFYKEKAHEWGCSIENPSLFFLSHAFCEKIENISAHYSLVNKAK